MSMWKDPGHRSSWRISLSAVSPASMTGPISSVEAWFGWTGAGTLLNENEAVYLVPVKIASVNGDSFYEATQQVRVYEPAGTTPRFCFDFGLGFTGSISWTATAWGYLVNAS